jgi:hypothetical protein
MFSTKGQEVKQGGGTAKSLQAGVVYAHIYSGQVRTSNRGDKKTLELILEGPASEGFEGWPIDKDNPEGLKFTGQSSRVSATIWTDQFNDSNVSKNEIMYKIAIIASELGMRDQIDNIQASSLEEWVEKAISMLKYNNLYWFLKGTEEEYNGKTIIKLSLPKYKFVSSDESKLDAFDKNNQYHYKALQNKPVSSFEPVNSDFDM